MFPSSPRRFRARESNVTQQTRLTPSDLVSFTPRFSGGGQDVRGAERVLSSCPTNSRSRPRSQSYETVAGTSNLSQSFALPGYLLALQKSRRLADAADSIRRAPNISERPHTRTAQPGGATRNYRGGRHEHDSTSRRGKTRMESSRASPAIRFDIPAAGEAFEHRPLSQFSFTPHCDRDLMPGHHSQVIVAQSASAMPCKKAVQATFVCLTRCVSGETSSIVALLTVRKRPVPRLAQIV